MDTCCQGSGNDCNNKYGSNYCYDCTSSAAFLFRLQPGDPQRFLPKPGGDATVYQLVDPQRSGRRGATAAATSSWTARPEHGVVATRAAYH